MYFRRWIIGVIVGVLVSSGFCVGMLPAVWGYDHPKKHKQKRLAHKGRVLRRVAHKVVHQMPDRPPEKQNSSPQIGFSTIPSVAKPAIAKEYPQQPTVTVMAQSESGHPAFIFDWGHHQPAIAVVKQPAGWWIVFDQVGKAILPDISQGLTLLPADDGVVMHFAAPDYLMPVVTMKGNKWHVLFTPQLLKLEEVEVTFPETKKDGVAIGLEDSGEKVHFQDPQTGFRYIVVPSYKVGVGLAQEQIFPEFHLLSTAQGLAFQVLSDNIAVNTAWMKATISHPKGLAITLPEQRNVERNRAIPIGFFLEAQDLDWGDRRQRISNELLDSPHDLHSAGELELTWLLLSHGKASDALGYLTHLAQERPSIVDQPLFQTLQGVSHLLLNKFQEAEAYFHQVREEPEVKVWLNLIDAVQPSDQLASSALAFQRLRAEKPLLETYPKPLRAQIYRIIVMAALAQDNLETVTDFLGKEPRPQNIIQGEAFDLGSAKLLMQKKPEAALQLLGKLMENASDPQVKALAHFEYVVHRVNTKMMSTEDAISHLERLYLSWRQNDWFRYRLGTYLADLFMIKKRYGKAMELYQTTFKALPERARADNIPRRMSTGFLSYFQSNSSATPLETLTFFQDYKNTVREAIQNSPEWHQIVRQVLKVLVGADLLNPAVEILSDYLGNRNNTEMSALEKAKIQHQVAALYLMTLQTEAALKLIHQLSDIPPELKEAHAFLQAEALVQQNKIDEAIGYLKDIKMATPLRAEMYFKARRWVEAAAAFKAMIGLEKDPEKKAACILNCVISMALSHDTQGLTQMQQSYGDWMKNTPHQAAFEFITDDKIPISGETHLIDLAKIDRTPSFLKSLFEGNQESGTRGQTPGKQP